MPVITDTELLYLQRINRFEALGARQLMRLFRYSENSYTTVTDRLKRMEKRKLLVVEAKIQDTTKKIAGAFKLYGIGPVGEEVLKAEGISVPRRNPTRSVEYWRHSMAVTDMLIDTVVWVEAHPGYEIVSMLTEYDIQRSKLIEPILVTLPSGETVRVEPDAIVEIEWSGNSRTIIFEIERGQEGQRAYSQNRWNEKLEKLVALWDASENRETVYIVIIAMRGEEQAQTLRKWTDIYLHEHRKQYLSSHIFITHEYDPSHLLA